jgi:hypothetical protein
MPWDNIGGTSSTYYTITDDIHTGKYYIGKDQKPKNKKSKKSEYCSEPLSKIVTAGIISGHIAMFAHRGSPVFKDAITLKYSGILAYFNDPVIPEPEYARPTELSMYNFSVIIDALEYMPGKMAKANLIKESISVLKSGSDNPYVIVLTKTRKMIEDMAKNNKYEELKDGFFITDGPFKKSIIQGLDTEDILELAHFAGAKYIEEDTIVKTDLTCVKIYLHKQG